MELDQVYKIQEKSQKEIEGEIKKLLPLFLLSSNVDFYSTILKRIEDNQKQISNSDFRDKELKTILKTYVEAFILQLGAIVSITKDNKLQALLKWFKEPLGNTELLRAIQTGKVDSDIFHKGKGLYTSAFKNITRISDSEILLKFRYAEHQVLKKAKGIKISLSPAHPRKDICDDLVGYYPPDFFFTGFHTKCMCIAEPVNRTVKDIPDNFYNLDKKFLIRKYNE